MTSKSVHVFYISVFIQKEMERLETQRLQEELNNKASNHYRIALLQRRGLHPWWKFVQQCNANKKAADKLSVYLLQRTMFRKWKNCWCSVMAEKEVKAQTLRSKILLRRLWRAWIRVRMHGQYILNYLH